MPGDETNICSLNYREISNVCKDISRRFEKKQYMNKLIHGKHGFIEGFSGPLRSTTSP